MNRAALLRQQAQAKFPGAVVVRRNRNQIYQRAPDGTNILDTTPGGLHFGPAEDQEIETAWQPGVAPWDYQMVLADYKTFALSQFSSGQIVKYVDPLTGESVTFQPQQLQWTNDLDQIQAIGNVQSVQAVIADDELHWTNAFGPGLDFVWETQTQRLSKRLHIPSLAAIGSPNATIIAGGNPVLRLQFIFGTSNGVDVYLDGQLWDKKTRKDTGAIVEFRSAATGQPLWWFGLARIYDESEVGGTLAIQRFRKQANNLFVEVRVPWSWLQSAIYPVVVDPTIDNRVVAGADDAHEGDGGAGFTATGAYINASSNTAGGSRLNGGFRHVSIGIEKGSTITTCYQTITERSNTYDDPNCDLLCENVDNAQNFTDNADVTSRARTTAATVAWTATGISSPANSSAFTAHLQQVIDRASWASGNAVVVFFDGKADANYAFQVIAYETNTSTCALLHIEYTDPPRTGTLTKTLDGLTFSLIGTVDVQGTASKTLDATTISAAGTVADAADVTGTLTATLGNVTILADGDVDVVGSLSKTLDAATISSAGTVDVVGSLNKALDAATISSAGTVDVQGTASKTLDATTIASAGAVEVQGTASKTLDAFTISSAGVVGDTPITGTLTVALGDITIASAGAVEAVGSLSKTLDALTIASAGQVEILGQLAVALAAMTIVAAGGQPTLVGSLDKTLAGVTLKTTQFTGSTMSHRPTHRARRIRIRKWRT